MNKNCLLHTKEIIQKLCTMNKYFQRVYAFCFLCGSNYVHSKKLVCPKIDMLLVVCLLKNAYHLHVVV